MTKFKSRIIQTQAGMTAALLVGMKEAEANTFSDIAANITRSVEELPGMITGFSYLFGLLLGVLGVLKVKDHVENPSQTPLKDGAIRMASGGALFALPIVYESMGNTIGTTGVQVAPAILNRVEFQVR